MDLTTYIMDGHNDLPWAMRELNGYDLDAADLATGVAELQTDIPRLRAGGVGRAVLVGLRALLAVGRGGGDGDPGADRLRQDDGAPLPGRPSPWPRPRPRSSSAVAGGRIASLMGMEGGHSIDGSLGVLRAMHALGVRYLTLTHNENVPWADSATDQPALGGLSDFGRDVVREMNRIGMFVDLSHVSADVMRDALETTSAPVIFSHSSARALCDNSRNVPDDVLAPAARQRRRLHGDVRADVHLAGGERLVRRVPAHHGGARR